MTQTCRRIVFFMPARVGDFYVCHVLLRLVVLRRFVRLVDRFERPRHDAYQCDCPADDRRHRTLEMPAMSMVKSRPYAPMKSPREVTSGQYEGCGR